MTNDIKDILSDLKTRLSKLGRFLDLDGRREKINKLEQLTVAPDFWSDNQKAQTILKEISDHKKWLEKINRFTSELSDHEELLTLTDGDENSPDTKEIKGSLDKMSDELDKFELTTLLSGPDDARNAIATIHPGAGGTESQDWASMLLRMYTRWAEIKGYKVSLLDYLEGEEAGLKSATLEITGEYAYGYLKAESGVHRLVRISPFDANNRRHTSFVSIFVIPEVDDNIEIEIKDDDLRIDTYRSSGAGGQHVNKTSSAVRITHFPTGIVVACQNERSQIKNREMAFKILRSRLYLVQVEEQKKKQAAIEKTKKKIEWGSQIRSYVFHPYNLVKDHRTDTETSNIQSVMDGNIDIFIEAYLADPDLQEN
ncbi:MAG: peptide chain release factor 2 [candidate division Zixibacteria bacterium]|nr:peptide chain release factor 2 [candidate division Zixibacteria bacterium]